MVLHFLHLSVQSNAPLLITSDLGTCFISLTKLSIPGNTQLDIYTEGNRASK